MICDFCGLLACGPCQRAIIHPLGHAVVVPGGILMHSAFPNLSQTSSCYKFQKRILPQSPLPLLLSLGMHVKTIAWSLPLVSHSLPATCPKVRLLVNSNSYSQMVFWVLDFPFLSLLTVRLWDTTALTRVIRLSTEGSSPAWPPNSHFIPFFFPRGWPHYVFLSFCEVVPLPLATAWDGVGDGCWNTKQHCPKRLMLGKKKN